MYRLFRISAFAILAATAFGGPAVSPANAQILQDAIRQGQSVARDSSLVWYRRATEAAATGRYGPAIAAMRRAIEYLPGERQLHIDLADLLVASGDRIGAQRELEALANEQDPPRNAVMRLGDLFLAQDDTAKALVHYRRLAAETLPYPPALLRLGDVVQANGDRAAAVDYYRRAVRVDSGYVEAWVSLGTILTIMDRYDEAMRAFNAAENLAPDAPEVRQIASLGRQRKRDYDEGTAAGRMRARIIVVATRDEAERLRRSIANGADFLTIAMQHSTDPTAQVGGDLGFFGPGELLPQFEQAVSRLRPGQMSEVIQIPSGYAIISRVN